MYKKFLAQAFILVSVFCWVEKVDASLDYGSRRTQETKYVDKYFEVDKNNASTNIFLPNGQKIATVVDDGDPLYVLQDHLSSAELLLNQNSELLTQKAYDLYGRTIYSLGRFDYPYTFSGKELDSESDLQYFGARYYDNKAGKFISVDPALLDRQFILDDPQTLNTYSYVTNNPLRYIDLFGETRADYIAPSILPQKPGDPGGTYKGVQLYAGNGGLYPSRSQCVVGVQNLYQQTMGINLRYGLGAAKNYGNLSAASNGGISYFSQGSTIMPQENDIITWDNNNIGHVGMIIEVNFDNDSGQGVVYTLEQNHSLNQEVFSYKLNGQKNESGEPHYSIEGFGNYKVVSWQRVANTNTNSAPLAAVSTHSAPQVNWYQKLWDRFKSLFK